MRRLFSGGSNNFLSFSLVLFPEHSVVAIVGSIEIQHFAVMYSIITLYFRNSNT